MTRQPDAPLRIRTDSLDRCLTDLEIRLHNVPWDGRTKFCIMGRTVGPNDARRYMMVSNLELREVAEGEELQPTFSFRRDQMQTLMDELYRIGVRPSEAGTLGELAAVKAHLKDMRAIVAGALDIPEFRPSR